MCAEWLWWKLRGSNPRPSRLCRDASEPAVQTKIHKIESEISFSIIFFDFQPFISFSLLRASALVEQASEYFKLQSLTEPVNPL